MIKIIAGKYKGRIIPTLKNSQYRPSTGKFKEAVFSILTSGEFAKASILEGAKVLDLFTGTGSLGFEALSRGAADITLIDSVAENLKQAMLFAEHIGEIDNTKVLCMNACALPKASYRYDLVFMDPPYHQNFVEKSLTSLLKGKWLETGAIIVVEISKIETIDLPEVFELIKTRHYGYNKLILLKYPS